MVKLPPCLYNSVNSPDVLLYSLLLVSRVDGADEGSDWHTHVDNMLFGSSLIAGFAIHRYISEKVLESLCLCVGVNSVLVMASGEVAVVWWIVSSIVEQKVASSSSWKKHNPHAHTHTTFLPFDTHLFRQLHSLKFVGSGESCSYL